MKKVRPIHCKRNYFIEWKAKGVMFLFLIAFLMTGCTRYTWKIEPSEQIVDNEYFSASISPNVFDDFRKGYIAFDLTIKNHSSEDIELDWNKTLYIENNQTKGGFVFEGIIYRDKNNPKLPDIIFSGAEFRKTICPSVLVLYDKRWNHDLIPSGHNGVYLTVKIKDKEVNEKILLDMSKVPSQ